MIYESEAWKWFVGNWNWFVDSVSTPEVIWGAKAAGIGVGVMLGVTLTFGILMRITIGRRMNMDDWPQSR